tara:strand:+ start:101 stop:502 length:402 start_codon:yes stop_codon:yes gene_type:complete
MPPILGGYGTETDKDIASGQQSTYKPPAPQPYTYVAPAGQISGVAGGTTFYGDEARRVETYVTGVAREQAYHDAATTSQTLRDRITHANAETAAYLAAQAQGVRQTVTGGASFLGGEILPIAAAAGAALILLR